MTQKEAIARWKTLSPTQQAAMNAMVAAEKRDAPEGGAIARRLFSGVSPRVATRTLNKLCALGLVRRWDGCQTVYAMADEGRELIEKLKEHAERDRVSDAETTVSGRRRSRCDADGRLRKMIRNCPRPPKG